MKARKLVFSKDMSCYHYGDVLCCPNCGGEYLHHTTIEVFNRKHEDSWHGLHCIIDDTKIRADIDASKGNPSERRNGIKIKFWCEYCGLSTWLHILQHKGNTYIGWSPVSFTENNREMEGQENEHNGN